MKIVSHTGGLASTNCYLVIDESSKQCVLFDAPDHTVAPILDMIERDGLELIGLWLTHGHFDHLADHKMVIDRFAGAKVLIHKLDEPKLLKPGSAMFPLPFTIPPGKADAYLEDGQMLKIGSIELKVIHTPGHSPGHVCFYIESEAAMIGGDLIIGGAVGRTDLPDSSEADLFKSIKTIMKLPAKTTLLPGHGTPSTLEWERANNSYVAMAK